MKLDWMGRYRDLVGELMKFGNVYSRVVNKQNIFEFDVLLRPSEWQVLESVYEHQDGLYNMAYLANKLGLPQSNFSKYVKTLCEMGLVERYYRQDNNKDIVLRLSEAGQAFYHARALALNKAFQEMYKSLEDVPDEYLDKFTDYIHKMTTSTYSYIDKTYERTDQLRRID